MNAVDTNIPLYSVDDTEPAKQAKARSSIQWFVTGTEPIALLWQTLVEAVNQLRRWKAQGELTDADFDQHVQMFRTLYPLAVPSLAVLDHALDLAKRHSLSHWDSMILGACKDAGVATLYTEDMGSPTNVDGIKLMNPLI